MGKSLRRGIAAALVGIGALGPAFARGADDAGSRYGVSFHVPFGGVWLAGVFPASLTTDAGTLPGTAEFAPDVRGNLTGKLTLASAELVLTGSQSVRRGETTLRFEASDAENTIRLVSSQVVGSTVVGDTRGEGPLAPRAGTLTLDVATALPLTAHVSLDVVTGPTRKVTGSGYVQVGTRWTWLTARGRLGGSLRLSGSYFDLTLTATGRHKRSGVRWRASGFGAVGRGNELHVPFVSSVAGMFSTTDPAAGRAFVAFRDEEGTARTIDGVPGAVGIEAVAAAFEADVRSAVESRGGRLVAGTPATGLYVAEIAPGTEADFMDALRTDPLVADVFPVPVAASAAAAVGAAKLGRSTQTQAGDVAVLDDFVVASAACDPAILHGDAVVAVVERLSADEPHLRAARVEIAATGPASGERVVRFDRVAAALTAIADAATLAHRTAVVNIALAGGGPQATGVDRHGASDPDCVRAKDSHRYALKWIYATVQNLDAVARSHVAVVVIAGDAGVDLTPEIAWLTQLHPDAAQNILVVGATDGQGTPLAASSSSTTRDDMLFAMGHGVAATVGDATVTCTGTAFAGAQVARLLGQLVRDVPGLGADQYVAAVRRAAAPGGAVVPFLPNGFVSMPAFDAAAAVAGTTYDLDVRWDTGGYVSVVPNKPRYHAGDRVRLTPGVGAGYSFVGWEGDCGEDSVCELVVDRDIYAAARFVVTDPNQFDGYWVVSVRSYRALFVGDTEFGGGWDFYTSFTVSEDRVTRDGGGGYVTPGGAFRLTFTVDDPYCDGYFEGEYTLAGWLYGSRGSGTISAELYQPGCYYGRVLGEWYAYRQ